MKKYIVEFDIDYATYIGDGNGGVYFQVAQKRTGKNKGWYITAVVDSETGAFTDNLVNDDGPYSSESEAITAGKNCAYDWCLWNDVNWQDELHADRT